MTRDDERSLPCTVCGGPSRLERRIPDATLFRCPACDHCFTDPESVDAPEAYGSEYFEITHRRWFQNPNVRLFARIARDVARLPADAAVIDIGCGRGDFLQFLRRAHPRWTLVGVDLAAPPSEDGIRFVRGDLLTTRIGRTFDVVVSVAVIEHMADVHGFVQRLGELCAPGGVIVITTNHERGLLYGIARVLHRLGYRQPCERLYSKHHLNHFNVSSLTRLLRGHGYAIEAIHFDNTPIAAVDIPVSSGATEAVLRAMVWGMWLIGRLTRRTFLQTIVCRRPR